MKKKINFLNFIQNNNNDEKINKINEIEKLIDNNTEKIEFEKIFCDLGPFINNNFNIEFDNEIFDVEIDEKRLAKFIIFVVNNPSKIEDKENKNLNKLFLQSLNLNSIEENENSNEKKLIWDFNKFYKNYKNIFDNLDKNLIINNFDDPNFDIKNEEKLKNFISISKTLKIFKSNDDFFNMIFHKWENELNQIEFLSFLLKFNPQNLNEFSFKNYNGKKITKNFEFSQISKNQNNQFLIEPWFCISLYEVLLNLSTGNYYVKVKEIFNWPIQNVPELIALGLISLQNSNDFLFTELIQEVLTLFLGNHINSFAVIEEVWNKNKELVIRTISNMYNNSPDLMNLSRILDISQKLKDSLILLVNCDDYNFAVNLAILAVKRDFLHIEQWLKDRISKVGDDFIHEILKYIKENLIVHCRNNNTTTKENILEKSQLSIESLAVIFENLVSAKHNNNPKISQNTEEEIKEVYKSIFNIFDELQIQPINSEEIEKTANNIFQSMFKGETTIYETIEKLKEFKESPEQKEREIYACMIHCLLDEYRFYHQYPEKQLMTVSQFFGQIIKNRLIDGVIETIALKYIIEGIIKGTGPMFIF